MKRRLCFVTTLPATIRYFLIDLLYYLEKKDEFDIFVICTDTKGFEKELPDRVTYIPVHMERGFSLTGIKATYKLYKIFKSYQFDIIQYSTANAGCYSSIASRLAGAPVRLYCQWGLDYIHLKGIKALIFEIIERVICSNSTHIQPDSFENLYISIREKLYTSDKGMVIGKGSASGVNLCRFDISQKQKWRDEVRSRFKISKDTFVFGYVGRILGQKGINEMLDAMKCIFEQNNNVKLLLVGDDVITYGVDTEKLKWARENDRIIFAGFSSEPEKFYSAMDCFVFPSYHEGFGTALIEAEALAVPIIASDIPGPREAIKNGVTGILVPRMNTEKLLEAMLFILNNSFLCNEYGNNAFKYVCDNFEQQKLFELIYENRIQLLEGKQ